MATAVDKTAVAAALLAWKLIDSKTMAFMQRMGQRFCGQDTISGSRRTEIILIQNPRVFKIEYKLLI
ncbi:hypothetical protein ATO67_20825 [Agrobacterium bohemicum]|uniref:Uncharacterized protein n=1 Tax=Agrobacterium bohemicum TaxID=2052828 RepID=A0A135P726_9HYPH|nr:hypothetical protein ATO67_20825 [Agrobacterium bohemicum]